MTDSMIKYLYFLYRRSNIRFTGNYRFITKKAVSGELYVISITTPGRKQMTYSFKAKSFFWDSGIVLRFRNKIDFNTMNST